MSGRLTPHERFIRKPPTVIALAVGFTAVPTVALAATDAVPGDPFKLGQQQRIDKASTILEGTGQLNDGVLQVRKGAGGIGPALRVVNSGPGHRPARHRHHGPVGPAAALGQRRRRQGLQPQRRQAGRQERGGLHPEPALRRRDRSRPRVGRREDRARERGELLVATRVTSHSARAATPSTPRIALNGIVPFRSSYQIEFTDNGSASDASART